MNMICVSLGTLPNSMLEVVLSNNNKHCKAHFEKVDSRKVYVLGFLLSEPSPLHTFENDWLSLSFMNSKCGLCCTYRNCNLVTSQ